jgi:hypothetical protein
MTNNQSVSIVIRNSCLTTQVKWNYTGVKLSPESSVTFFAYSPQLNTKYQFRLHMSNRQNASRQTTVDVLVQIESFTRPMIAIG